MGIVPCGSGPFPNLLVLIRDPARSIRIAARALHQAGVYGEMWRESFDDSHSLVPDFMNSQKWRNLFVALEGGSIRAATRPGSPQPLAGVMRNLAFAKRRSYSTAGPAAKLARVLLPAAALLAHVAADRRHERDQRERATALVKQMVPSSASPLACPRIGASSAIGVCADLMRHAATLRFRGV